jgi:putative ABC transport system ATP-binding protein
MSLIILKDAEKKYKLGEVEIPALKKVNLEIEKSRFISFVGPSGSGKTTILNLIGCLDKPSAGSVIINGTNTNTLSKEEAADFRGNNIGFIFQNFNLIPVLSVYENVEYPLLMVKKTSKDKIRPLVETILKEVGIFDQIDKKPEQLSGGQRQRVAIARALITNPKVVLADEPTANLDHKTAGSIIRLMHEMKNRYGTVFIFATHDPKVMKEAEVIYELEDGEIKSISNGDAK